MPFFSPVILFPFVSFTEFHGDTSLFLESSFLVISARKYGNIKFLEDPVTIY